MIVKKKPFDIWTNNAMTFFPLVKPKILIFLFVKYLKKKCLFPVATFIFRS